jgi:hypothetical protein
MVSEQPKSDIPGVSGKVLDAAIPVIRNAAIHQYICSEHSERKTCLCGIALLCLAYVKANTYELLTLIFEIPPGVKVPLQGSLPHPFDGLGIILRYHLAPTGCIRITKEVLSIFVPLLGRCADPLEGLDFVLGHTHTYEM